MEKSIEEKKSDYIAWLRRGFREMSDYEADMYERGLDELVTQAIEGERKRIEKELCVSWDSAIDTGSTWDLGNALIVVKVPMPTSNEDNEVNKLSDS